MPTRQLARVLADSISPDGVRLSTILTTMPRIVLPEFNTHRRFARNSASSRAIPIEKMLQRVMEDPFVPEDWGQNGRGMQDHGALDEHTRALAKTAWLVALDDAIESARHLLSLGVHKQHVNRLLEPFMWHTVIVTATEWSNFFNLRCSPLAQPEIRRTAEAMRDVLHASEPECLDFDEWHLPLVDERDADLSTQDKLRVSVARCARVSYLTHDGVRDVSKDLELHDSLLANGHMSPFEHAARPLTFDDLGYNEDDCRRPRIHKHFSGPFRGWWQYRKSIAGEHDIVGWQRGDYL